MSAPEDIVVKKDEGKEAEDEADVPDMSLLDICDGDNGRGIPVAKFVDDIDAFSSSFTPAATAELLIGAFSRLHAKYKSYEESLTQKLEHLREKIPELEKSLLVVKTLIRKKEEAAENSGVATGLIRYSLAENIYANAEIDYANNSTVNLWLGANVMLEYTYEEAVEFLEKNLQNATRESNNIQQDLAFVRDQIVTSEVNVSRIYNWDVRKRRENKQQEATS